MKSFVTPEMVRRYQDEGYLVLKTKVFSPEKLARCKELADRKFAEATRDGRTPALVDCPHWSDPAVWEFIAADEMLDLIEPIVGPNIGIFACHLLKKPAGVGKRVPWHEDSAYWKDALTPMEVSSITLAIEPSIPQNGCLRVIPGTHRGGYSEYNPVTDDQVFGIEIKPQQFDESRAVDVSLQPNEASVHECKIMHGSNPNTSPITRSVLTVRYFSTSVKFTPERHPAFKGMNFPIYLARGRDLAGNTYADPAKPRGGGDRAGTAV